jgi:hypothetical protein
MWLFGKTLTELSIPCQGYSVMIRVDHVVMHYWHSPNNSYLPVASMFTLQMAKNPASPSV